MPEKPPRPCTHPGCSALVQGRDSRCQAHRRERWRRQNARRPNFHERGYRGARWRRVREKVLDAEPGCRECKAHGRTTPATCVDHIIPKAVGEQDYDLENLQPLCHSCHSAKTMRELNEKRGRGSR